MVDESPSRSGQRSERRQHIRYLEKEDRRRRLTGQCLTVVTLLLGVYYLVWHWQRINWDGWHYSFVFFLAESVGLLLFCFFAYNAWFLRYHDPQGVPSERSFSVDIFIPVAGEAVDLVRQTVEAALRVDFQSKRVYILDDKGDAEYQKIAEESGCGYFARKEHVDAKAGNLNYAFSRTDGDLILVLDADQVPKPQIINTLIGYFKIPRIGFVQTKQDFKVPIGDPFGNRDRIFYNVMQSGKDNDNAAFSCGSGVIYRREALREIGGFSTWNLVEDVHTSMLLHQRGWRSIYYNHPLTQGTAPTDVHGVYRQRRQWAADSLRLQFWDNPFWRKGLTLKQKLQYFNLGFVYLVSGFVMPLFFLTPSLSLLARKFVLTSPVDQYVLHRVPYFIAMSLAYGLINYPTPYMRAFQMWTGLFPVFIHATWIALRSRVRKPVYRVNVKSVDQRIKKNPLTAILPQIGVILLGFFAAIYTFIAGGVAWDFYLLNFLWIIWSSWTMSGICLAAIKKPRWPDEKGLEVEKPASFISRTRELFLTIALTIVVALFFVTVDPATTDRFMNDVRNRVLGSVSVEKPAPPIEKRDLKGADAPAAQAEEAVGDQKDEGGKEKVQSERWAVQVISVRTEKQALMCKEQLGDAGFESYVFPADPKGKAWIGVRVGFFESKEEAEGAAKNIRNAVPDFKGAYWVVKLSAREKEALPGD